MLNKKKDKIVHDINIEQTGNGNIATVVLDENGIVKEFANEISFQHYVSNAIIPTPIYKNKFSYRNPKIAFHGRTNEKFLFDEFMNNERSVLLWSITGDGGIGKSKFALYLAALYKKNGWDTVWLDINDTIKICRKYSDYSLVKPCLFIFDYAGSFVDEIAQFVNLIRKSKQTGKIRILLIERAAYKKNESNIDSWYSRLKYKSDDVEEIEYNPTSLNLKEHPLQYSVYSNILSDFSEKELKEFQKREIIAYVKDISLSSIADNGKVEQNLRCLFLLFAADAYLDNHDLSHWKAIDLIKRCLDHSEKIIEQKYSKKISTNGKIILAFSTAFGGVDFETSNIEILNDYIDLLKNELDFHMDTRPMKEFLKDLCEKETDDLFVSPLVPDIIGEVLFVKVFYNLSSSQRKKWLTALLSQNYFYSFLERCISDWFELSEVQFLIEQLLNTISNEDDAYSFINTFVNASSVMNTSTDILCLASKIEPIVDKYATNRLYGRYIGFLINAVHESEEMDILSEDLKKIFDEIEEIESPELAIQYAQLLVNISAKDNDCIFQIVNELYKLLEKYNSSDIADVYVNSLLNWSSVAKKSEDIDEIIDKLLCVSHKNEEIELAYAKILYNATAIKIDVETKKNYIERIKEIIKSNSSVEIKCFYVSAIANIVIDLPIDEIDVYVKIAKSIVESNQTDEIIEQMILTLINKAEKDISIEEMSEDLVYAKSILSNHKTLNTVLRYSQLLLNATVFDFSADFIEEMSNEVYNFLDEFDTQDIAHEYMSMLVNEALKLDSYDSIQPLVEKAKKVLDEKYNSIEFVSKYCSILVNQSSKTADRHLIKNILDDLQDKLNEWKCDEIAKLYLKAVANSLSVINLMDIYPEIMYNADKIVLEYDSENVATEYSCVLQNKILYMNTISEENELAEKILNLHNKYNSRNILLSYITTLANSTIDTNDKSEQLKILKKIEYTFDCNNDLDIAVQYAKALFNYIENLDDESEGLDVLSKFQDKLIDKYTESIEIYKQYGSSLVVYANMVEGEKLIAIVNELKGLFERYKEMEFAEYYSAGLAFAIFDVDSKEEKVKFINELRNDIYPKYKSEKVAVCISTAMVALSKSTSKYSEMKDILKEIRSYYKTYHSKVIKNCLYSALKNIFRIYK